MPRREKGRACTGTATAKSSSCLRARRFTLGADQRVARAGEVVVAPAGVAHRFVNTGQERLRQVDIHEHARFETEWL
jgi:oxalate decarboxylase/phosphoglucose isomerase-like protein (cupin superfamily)